MFGSCSSSGSLFCIKGNPNCDKGLMDLNSPDYDFAREWRGGVGSNLQVSMPYFYCMCLYIERVVMHLLLTSCDAPASYFRIQTPHYLRSFACCHP